MLVLHIRTFVYSFALHYDIIFSNPHPWSLLLISNTLAKQPMPAILPSALGRKEDPIASSLQLLEMLLTFLEERIAGPQGTAAPVSIASSDAFDSTLSILACLFSA